LTQAWECTPGKELAWNVLSLLTTSGMLFLEVSLVAFLFQGNHVSGLEALTRTFVVSGLIVGMDFLLKVFFASSLKKNPLINNITFSMMIRIQHYYGGRSIIFFLLICVLIAHFDISWLSACTLMDQ
jgi:uncharacterized protein YneF (UPF0154 family)